MNVDEREALIEEISDWTKYTPAGEYTTIRKILLMLVDIAFPMPVETWQDMKNLIDKDPKRARRFIVRDAPGYNKGDRVIYEYIPSDGIIIVASGTDINGPNQ